MWRMARDSSMSRDIAQLAKRNIGVINDGGSGEQRKAAAS